MRRIQSNTHIHDHVSASNAPLSLSTHDDTNVCEKKYFPSGVIHVAADASSAVAREARNAECAKCSGKDLGNRSDRWELTFLGADILVEEILRCRARLRDSSFHRQQFLQHFSQFGRLHRICTVGLRFLRIVMYFHEHAIY